jgi:UDP-glucose 4-epimerase
MRTRLRALATRHEEKLRFLVVGVWNTAFSMAVLWALERFIPHDASSVLQKQVILVVAWIFGVTQNFFTFKFLVFRTRGNWWREYSRMYVTYAATFVVQSVLVQTLSASFGITMFWANVPTLVLVTVMSYLGHKYFTFREKHIIEVMDAGTVFEHGKKMRVLVTGGAGYIGSITARMLLDAGHEVVVLDTLERGNRSTVDERATFVRGDVGDADAVRSALTGVDAVMHLAGYIEVAESVALPERYLDNNVARPTVMLDQMQAAGVDAIVFSSTAAVYGEPESVPITESAPTVPVNPYGASKLEFERELVARADSGLRAIVFRYFNVAGAWPDGSLGEAHDPETHIIPRILGAMAAGERSFEVYGSDYPTPDGTCVRDYIHVCDLARAHVIALERLHAGGEGGTFNLGNGDGYSNLQVVRACADATGIEVEVEFGPRRAGDPAVLVASSALARKVLGWEPQRAELSTIVADAWRWHAR